jgi:hypothetical protein
LELPKLRIADNSVTAPETGKQAPLNGCNGILHLGEPPPEKTGAAAYPREITIGEPFVLLDTKLRKTF